MSTPLLRTALKLPKAQRILLAQELPQVIPPRPAQRPPRALA